MTISAYKDDRLDYSDSPCWKGFHHAQTRCHDQIACSISKAGSSGSYKSTAPIFSYSFKARFYTATVIRHPDSTTILPDRLPWYRAIACRHAAVEGYSWVVESSPLHYPPKGTATPSKKGAWDSLLTSIFSIAKADGLIEDRLDASIDSTGLESHFVSRHFLMRQGSRTHRYRNWTKLTIVCHNASHLIAASIVSTGPSNDCPYLASAVTQAVRNMSIDRLLADAGYDAEENHRFCRQELGIRSTIIPINKRRCKTGRIRGHYRNQMKANFPKRLFGQRWQVESVVSRLKRRLGYALRGRTDGSRRAECHLRVLTYNLMLLFFTLFKEALRKGFYKARSNMNLSMSYARPKL